MEYFDKDFPGKTQGSLPPLEETGPTNMTHTSCGQIMSTMPKANATNTANAKKASLLANAFSEELRGRLLSTAEIEMPTAKREHGEDQISKITLRERVGSCPEKLP